MDHIVVRFILYMTVSTRLTSLVLTKVQVGFFFNNFDVYVKLVSER